MTEEPQDKKPAPPEKLLIDDLNDFQFHAAYLAYSNAFGRNSDSEIRKRLNENINALHEKQIDIQTFYRNISQYRREEGAQQQYGRVMIRTQKKKEWRRKTQKHERIERHKR
jgi:hypothetical protein